MVIPTTRPIPQAELQEPEVQPISTDWHSQLVVL
jgi:hypothetical protein